MSQRSFKHFHVNIGTPVDGEDFPTKKLDGREYMVVPTILLIEGVHNQEFISYDEIIPIYSEAWAGSPVTIDHPMDSSGKPVTANSPKVFEDSRVGFLFNMEEREDIQGLAGEVWIDVEKAAEVPGGSEAIKRIKTGKLEVSTGYFCITDNLPGEWMNPKTNKVEKYTSSQYAIRPDHLALLPYDTGACSWKDGCGAPRTNSDHSVESGEAMAENAQNPQLEKKMATQSPEAKQSPEQKKLSVNGKQVGKVLSAAMDSHGDAKGMMKRMAAACGIEMSVMQSIMDGEKDFIPRHWVNVFAAVLDIDPYELYAATQNDNSDARWKRDEMAEMAQNTKTGKKVEENASPTESSVTMTENEQEDASEKPCTPCQKSLKNKVLDILRSIGIYNNTATSITEEKETMATNTADAKKVKVDALIASDKNKFTENHREKLMAFNDEQIELLELAIVEEVKPTEAPAVNTAVTSTTPEVKEIKAESPAVTKAAVLQALGIDEAALAAIQTAQEERKAARANKIAAIAAIPTNKFTKNELESFSDETLSKTLSMLQPESPFRVAPRTNSNTTDDEIAVPPAILLAKPGQRGVDFAVQTERNKQRGIN